MVSIKVFSALAAVFIVTTFALLTAINDQRQEIFASSSPVTKLSSAFGDSLIPGAFAQEVTDNALFVSGSATASANPDKVTIHFSVETQDNSAQKSQQDNAATTAAVRSALTAIGISADSIETTGYTLYQDRQYDYEYRRYIDNGFKTIHTMKVELADTSRAGEVIDAAVSGGANNINSVSFGLSDSKLEELRLQALEAAAENARERADSIAEGLGVSINRVMSATESSSPGPVLYRSYAVAEDSAAGAVPTEVTPGEISVTATVSVVFEIS